MVAVSCNNPESFNHSRTFVIRTILVQDQSLHGQLSEPGSPDDWRFMFSSLEQLCQGLQERLEPLAREHPD